MFFVARAAHRRGIHRGPDGRPATPSRCLRIVALGFPLYAYGMVLTQSFNGAGDTRTPTWINLVCFWLFEIPLAWWLAQAPASDRRGVFWAIMASFSLLAVASAAVFRRGKWKLRVV